MARSVALRSPARRRPRPLSAVLAGGLALAAAAACDRNIEPFQPGEEPREPDLARIFPGPAAGQTSGGMAGDAAARAAFPPSRTEGAGGGAPRSPVDQAAAEAPAAAGSGEAPADGGGSISGRIEVALDLAGARPAGGVLFVIARPQGARGGPPLAVLRIPDPEFPLEFTIGPRDVMIPSMRFEGPISLSARLDADGNAMTRGETDLSSETAEGVAPGTTGLTLVLAQKG